MIPFFKPELPDFDKTVEALKEVFASKWVSNFGPFCLKFEARAREITGSKYAYALPSCDTGLNTALRVARLKLKKDKLTVAVPSFTFASTINVVKWNGCTPILCDINKETYCLDAKNVPPKADVIMPVHTFGNLIKKEDLDTDKFIIWDAAHAFGITGNQKDIQVFSFSGTKLVTSGEGGIITTEDDELGNYIKFVKNFGFYLNYDVQYSGINGKMSEFNAVIGYLSLDLLDKALIKRQHIVDLYKELLGWDYIYQVVPHKSAYKDFIVAFDKPIAEEISNKMANAGVETKRYFYPVHKMKAYKDEKTYGDLKNTDWLYDHSLCLPMYNELDDETIEHVVKIFKSCI